LGFFLDELKAGRNNAAPKKITSANPQQRPALPNNPRASRMFFSSGFAAGNLALQTGARCRMQLQRIATPARRFFA